MKPTTVKKA